MAAGAAAVPKRRGFFQFEQKFGWSELVSVIALLLASYGTWQSQASSRPQVMIEQLTPTLAKIAEGRADTSIVLLLPLSILNRGGRDVSLVGIRENGVIPWLAVSENDTMSLRPSFPYHVFATRTPAGRMNPDSADWRNAEFRTPEQLMLMSVPVESGRGTSLTLGVAVDSLPPASRAAMLFVTADLVFSDGTVLPVRNAFPLANAKPGAG